MIELYINVFVLKREIKDKKKKKKKKKKNLKKIYCVLIWFLTIMEKTSPSERPSWNCFLDRAMLFDHVYCNVGLVFLFLLAWYVCQCHPTGSARGRARVRVIF